MFQCILGIVAHVVFVILHRSLPTVYSKSTHRVYLSHVVDIPHPPTTDRNQIPLVRDTVITWEIHTSTHLADQPIFSCAYLHNLIRYSNRRGSCSGFGNLPNSFSISSRVLRISSSVNYSSPLVWLRYMPQSFRTTLVAHASNSIA